MSEPHVLLLTLGGTIFMTESAGGGHAAPDAEAGRRLAATAVDGLRVTARQLANTSSSDLRPHHWRRVLEEARAAVDDGAVGVVLTHGTDTLEETAFALSRLWDREAPLVITGAMRPASAPGADGPANLRDALIAAADPAARGLGPLVVFDGMLHLADQVTKASSRSVSAFASHPVGPVGMVDDGRVVLLQRPLPRPAPLDLELPDALPRVPALIAGIDEDLALLDHLPTGAIAGLVIAGVGMGHVAPEAMDCIRRLFAAGIPVVVATRIATGGTSEHHYAYPGSEVDLLAAGAVMAGFLPPAQARLLLQLLLAAGVQDVRGAFRDAGPGRTGALPGPGTP
ncbi:asparaginase [Brachybacterium sp. J144]|uniref:asparaginase n=1 Tax=Brachybacterium sp. J144 TaxID=3116487 RepID=UPI002E772975|nr:asparaginase [Brachybacterium sp. J144]MEE1650043.1 asparaginase [Brachybacterium sp. J144]